MFVAGFVYLSIFPQVTSRTDHLPSGGVASSVTSPVLALLPLLPLLSTQPAVGEDGLEVEVTPQAHPDGFEHICKYSDNGVHN